MIIILTEDQLDRAREIMQQYHSKLAYSKVRFKGKSYYAITEGPVGALLLIRAELGNTILQQQFGLE